MTYTATDLALQAYQSRPTRAEPLYDLAKHFRERGMNHAALLFAARALSIPQPDDHLFVETGVYRWGAREEYSIVAYSDLTHREKGREICNSLALDRDVPQQTRDMARQNLFWYCRSLAEQAPSFSPQRLQFDPPEGWNAMNPSVTVLGDLIAINIRTVNYRIDDGGRYIMPEGDPAIRTRNFLGTLDPDDVGRLHFHNEVQADLGVPLYDQVIGLEDIRLFDWRGCLYGSATVRQMNREGWCEIVLGEFRYLCSFHNHRVLSKQGRQEKNWMPIIGSDGLFIYSCEEVGADVAADNFSGGSQAIPFHDGYLALIHEAIQSPIDGKRCYQHRWVWFDSDVRLRKASHRFYFEKTNQIEFAAGLCRHPDGKRLIISYGVRDAEAWIATIDADEVAATLGIPAAAGECVAGRTAPAIPIADPDVSRPPLICERPLGDAMNRPLRHDSEIEAAIDGLRSQGLPLHSDRPKNWDNHLAVCCVERFCDKGEWIMDAGGTRESAFLSGLQSLGFQHLVNVNLDEEAHDQLDGGISYYRDDITELDCSPGSYGFIACLSVIEHGVDWRKFLNEMARVIRSGGHLFVSFDYWETKIDAGGQVAFGAPVTVFDSTETNLLIEYAKDVGFEVVGDVDLTCADRVVRWLGIDFTFMNLLFRRVAR